MIEHAPDAMERQRRQKKVKKSAGALAQLRAAKGGSGATTRIDDFEVRPINAARGARLPFFSPDGQWVGFVNSEGLWKVNLAGSPPVRLGNMTAFAIGGAWSPNGYIYMASSRKLVRYPENGGVGEEIPLEGVEFDVIGNPFVMPSGTHLLLTIGQGSRSTLIAVDLEVDGDFVATQRVVALGFVCALVEFAEVLRLTTVVEDRGLVELAQFGHVDSASAPYPSMTSRTRCSASTRRSMSSRLL